MKIALVHPFAWPDVRRGGERYLDDLAWYLRGAGHQVDVIAGSDTTTRSEGYHGREVRLRHLPTVTRRPVKLREPETFGVRAYPELLRRRYDVVHALVPSAALAAKAAGQRVAFTLLGYPTDALLDRHPTKRRVLQATMRTANAVTALSSQVADDVARSLRRRPTVLAPGVRTDRFAPLTRTVVPTVLFASAMRPEKGLDVLLRAFSLVAAKNTQVRLVLAGPGDPAWAFTQTNDVVAACRDRIDELGPGDPDDVPRLYASAHVTVLPSTNEAFGLALAESLAAGTPVVGCRGGGADDIVVDEVGRIVEFGDADALAAAIGSALGLSAEPDIADRCQARASLWDWAGSIGPQHEALYRAVIAGERP